MSDLVLLSTKNVHFSYNGDIYTQADSVAMDSPLGPVLAGIFMVELERTILPTLKEHMSPWKRYVDDTISYIKEESIEHVLSKWNGYHENIEFTYEIEKDGKLLVIDILVIRKDYEVEKTVYSKVQSLTLAVVFPNSMETRDATDINFKSLQRVLQWPTLAKWN